MTYIPFIYILKPNGFIEETKFKQEIDLSTLKIGQNITNFYKEIFPLYNIYLKNEDNSYTLFKDNIICSLTQDEIKEQIFTIFPEFLNQVASSGVNDLLNDYQKEDGTIYQPSVFKEYLRTIQLKTSVSFEPVITNFSLDKYINLANQLTFLADCIDNVKLQYFIKASVKAFNSFLAYDHIIEDFSHGMFSKEKEENTEKEVIYFTNAKKTISYAQNMCDSSFGFDFKEKSKKLKV